MSDKYKYGTMECLIRVAPYLIIGLPLTEIFFPLGIAIVCVGFWRIHK